MKTFVGEEFAGDAGLDWEQVKVDKGGGDVLSGFTVEPVLEPISGNPRWDSVAVVLAGD